MTIKTKSLLICYLAGLVLCMLLTNYFSFSHTSSAAALTIQYSTYKFPSVKLQQEPYFTNTLWWTNMYGTNIIIHQGDSTYNTALVGPVVKLIWDNADNTILTWSTNLTDWQDIKIVWIGPTGCWYSYPQDKRFYKLRSALPVTQ